MRKCRAVMDTTEGGSGCVKRSGHKPPHRTQECRWTNDDQDLGFGVMEWTKPRGIGDGLFRGRKVPKSSTA